jgi:hypothetical protein
MKSHIAFYLNQHEVNSLQAAAEAEALPVSIFVRRVVLHALRLRELQHRDVFDDAAPIRGQIHE